MKFNKSFLIFALSFSLVSISFLSYTTQTVYAQESRIALQRGYRTGYSDGYMSGYRDAIDSASKNHGRHAEYSKADRAFSKEYGTIEDYRDGYQQGFESGYSTGFEKRSFDATIPTAISKRGIVAVKTVVEEPVVLTPKVEEKTSTEVVATNKVEEPVKSEVVAEVAPEPAPTYTSTQSPVATSTNTESITEQSPILTTNTASLMTNGDTILIPTDTELIVELLDDIDTDRSREGDRFKARIISPNELSGAIIEGRVSKIQKPGRIKRRAEMLLSFDRVILSENRWSNFNAIITEVLPRRGDNVKRVDTEGTVEGRRTAKEDSIKIGATTGTGLVVGAIAGGPVGAAVGAGVGAAFGVGAVVVERGKHIRLDKDQQLRIKSAYETQIR